MTARPVCVRCRRPQSACWCADIVPVESRVRACFLQHPRERKVAVGTAWMAHLSLSNSELHQGVDFGDHPRVRELAGTPGTALLFPGEDAVEPAALSADPPRVLIVVDGTWSQARKVVHQNPFLQKLPRVGFTPRAPSNYRIRKQPAEFCVSTIEAVAHVLGELEADPGRFKPLLERFDRMVDLQLEFISRRAGQRRTRRKRQRRPRVDGTIAELRSRPGDVVAIYAEANGPQEVPELIRLVAVRPASGERFEAVVAPRQPLAAELPAHVELEAAQLLAGEPIASALERFAAFLRPGDLYCGWGPYARELLLREGGPLRPFSDVRIACSRTLGRRAAGVEQAVRMLGRDELPAPMFDGRAGRRVSSLLAVVEALVREP